MRFWLIKIITCLLILSSIHTAFAKTMNRFTLVDTGYDACVLSKMPDCEKNQNLLFRGANWINSNDVFNVKKFRKQVFSYLTLFRHTFRTQAKLPTSEKELENYRIVIINLLYDYNKRNKPYELRVLRNEFFHSGQGTLGQLPQQHRMYGLTEQFNPNHYAFEWWPITFANVTNAYSGFIPMTLNFNSEGYRALNFTYLISGTSFAGEQEVGAKDIATLLKSQAKDNHPLLIFFHCIEGKDRTGAVSAGYLLKYGGYPFYMQVEQGTLSQRVKPTSLSQVLTYTTVSKQHPANHKSILLTQAYCLYLKKTGNSLLTCQ